MQPWQGHQPHYHQHHGGGSNQQQESQFYALQMMQLQQTQQLLHGMMLKQFSAQPSHAEQDVLIRKLEERLDEIRGRLEETKTRLEEASTRLDEQEDVRHFMLHLPSPWQWCVWRPPPPPKKSMPLTSLGPFAPFKQAGRSDADAGCKRMQLAQQAAATHRLCAEQRSPSAQGTCHPQQALQHGGPARFSPKYLPADARDGHVQAWVVQLNS